MCPADIDALAATRNEQDCPVDGNPRLKARFKAQREIAAAGVRDDDLARQLAEVGFDGDTIRVLVFIPLVEVAWADGAIQQSERDAIAALMDERGLEEGSRARALVEGWLAEEPCDALYTRGRALVSQIVNDARDRHDDAHWILMAARDIAIASTNVYAQLGLDSSITEQEEAVIRRLAEGFRDGEA